MVIFRWGNHLRLGNLFWKKGKILSQLFGNFSWTLPTEVHQTNVSAPNPTLWKNQKIKNKFHGLLHPFPLKINAGDHPAAILKNIKIGRPNLKNIITRDHRKIHSKNIILSMSTIKNFSNDNIYRVNTNDPEIIGPKNLCARISVNTRNSKLTGFLPNFPSKSCFKNPKSKDHYHFNTFKNPMMIFPKNQKISKKEKGKNRVEKNLQNSLILSYRFSRKLKENQFWRRLKNKNCNKKCMKSSDNIDKHCSNKS